MRALQLQQEWIQPQNGTDTCPCWNWLGIVSIFIKIANQLMSISLAYMAVFQVNTVNSSDKCNKF